MYPISSTGASNRSHGSSPPPPFPLLFSSLFFFFFFRAERDALRRRHDSSLSPPSSSSSLDRRRGESGRKPSYAAGRALCISLARRRGHPRVRCPTRAPCAAHHPIGPSRRQPSTVEHGRSDERPFYIPYVCGVHPFGNLFVLFVVVFVFFFFRIVWYTLSSLSHLAHRIASSRICVSVFQRGSDRTCQTGRIGSPVASCLTRALCERRLSCRAPTNPRGKCVGQPTGTVVIRGVALARHRGRTR